MKKIYFILFILSLVSNNSKSIDESINKNLVSKLIGNVREEIIDKSLLYLPSKNQVNILKMSYQMNKAKEDNSLNDVETAYLIFKWIAQNIKVKFFEEKDSDDALGVYSSGQGSPKGLSSLFNLICGFLDLKTDSISGYLKFANKNIDDPEITIIKEFTWNYIEIDGEYYLIDVSMASDLKGYNGLSDFIFIYFGTEPEIFIRLHFPNESKWQLLSKPYSLEKFESMALLYPFFYLMGLKTISPDTNILNGNGKFKLTSDKSIPKYQIEYNEVFDEGDESGEFITSDDETNEPIEISYNTETNKCVMICMKFGYYNIHCPSLPIVCYNTKYTKLSSFSLNRQKDLKVKK